MLVLSRRRDETIIIGDDIAIKVIEVRGKGENAVVRLGISAPSDVKILRQEVFLEVAREMRQAARSEELPDDLLSP